MLLPTLVICHDEWQVSLELACTHINRVRVIYHLTELVMAFERELSHAKVAIESVRKGQVSFMSLAR